ncbi:MAG: S9 family peptidase [Thermoprotei archaeon]|nr:MAG: S9 family peptidase [Thermoprotei archaeon]
MIKMKWDEKTFTLFAYPSDVRVSSRGEIAYVLTKANLESNKYENTIVIENPSEGTRKYVEDATMPRFSPSGLKMTYTRADEKEKKTTLYLLDLRSMSSRKIGEFKFLRSVEWCSDDRRLLIVGFKRRGDDDLIFEDDTPAWFDRLGFFDGEKVKIQVYDTEAEALLEEFDVPRFTSAIWHGDKIVYSQPRKENPLMLRDIYLYEDGKTEKLLENVGVEAVDSNGKDILFVGRPERKYLSQHRYLYLYREGELKPLTEELGLSTYDAKLDGNDVYFSFLEAGKVPLARVWNKKIERLVDEKAWVTSFDVENGKAALIMMSDTSPGEVYAWDGSLKQLTSYNEKILAKLKVRRHRHFKYKSFDGTEIEGWYIKPDVEEGKAPVVVFVHGGPKGMYGYRFDYMAQLLADRGFYILFTNPRGSNGYSEEFALKVLNRTGLEDFKDIMEGLRWLLENEPQADGDRVGITGISYGGFMTNWAVTQTDAFKAAVSENGISYWLTSYAFSDIGLWFDKEVIGDDPLRNENYRKLSPLFYAENVKTPILLIHSLEDYRCPLDQSLMFYHVLKDLGKEAYIAIFKQGAHGHSITGKPRHRMKRYKLIAEFFERKLVKGEKEFKIEEILKPGNK